MTREETKEAIKVMQAFVEGKVIQFLDRNKVWQDLDPKKGMGSNWNWFETAYRIKSEPHYRPFKNAEEFMSIAKEKGFVLKIKEGCNYVVIVEFTSYGIWAGSMVEDVTSFNASFDKYTFADGTPFGKLEE